MSEMLNVLICTKDIGFSVNSKDEDSLYELTNVATDILEQSLKGEIGGIKPATLQDTSGWILGSENPKKLIESARSWHEKAINMIKESINELNTIAGVWYLPLQLTTLHDQEKDMSDDKRHDYDMALYKLRQGVCATSGRFLYGGPGVIIEDTDDYYQDYTTQITPELMAAIEKNPENYVIIQLTYI